MGPSIIGLALLFATVACSEPATSTASTASSTTPLPALDAGVLDAFHEYLAVPSQANLQAIVSETAATADRRWVPYLLDLLRFTGDQQLLQPLEVLTGTAPPDGDIVAAYAAYGRAMLDRAIDPGTGYAGWKQRLYATVDPRFADLLALIDDTTLLAAMQWGGTPVGGVPELNHPVRVGAAEASYLEAGNRVFGVYAGGTPVAYPLRILDVHELANDTIAGIPVALVNCTLCRSGVLFSRSVEGRDLDFITSGLLLNSNKIMLDLQTGSLWQQLTGEAFAGPLAGTTLERLPMTVTTWGAWLDEHPTTEALALPDTGAGRGVEGTPTYEEGTAYAGYYATPDLWFPSPGVAGAFDEKTEVATIARAGNALAVDVLALGELGPIVLDVGAERVIVVPVDGGARFYLGNPESLDGAVAAEDGLVVGGVSYPRLISGQSFWFAWYAIHPNTAWWPEE